MHRVAAAIFLVLLSSCGSCLEDKKVPEVERTPSTVKTITKTTEAGTKRPILVGESVDFADLIKHGDGADGGV